MSKIKIKLKYVEKFNVKKNKFVKSRTIFNKI